MVDNYTEYRGIVELLNSIYDKSQSGYLRTASKGQFFGSMLQTNSDEVRKKREAFDHQCIGVLKSKSVDLEGVYDELDNAWGWSNFDGEYESEYRTGALKFREVVRDGVTIMVKLKPDDDLDEKFEENKNEFIKAYGERVEPTGAEKFFLRLFMPTFGPLSTAGAYFVIKKRWGLYSEKALEICINRAKRHFKIEER